MIFLIFVALIWIAKTLICICYYSIYGLRVFIWSRFRKIDLVKRYGEYVVLTGATEGIGFAMAIEFAKRGHSLIIIGRNESKLKNTKEVLSKITHSGRSVHTVVADLSSMDSSTYQRIEESVRQIDGKIGILVNNAGVFQEKPDKFLNIQEREILDNVKVNVAAVLLVTKTIMPFMVENRRGIVVNVGSLLAVKPSPLFNVYSASKKFVEYFTEALNFEYKSLNIEVQHLQPGFVVTRLGDWMKVAKVSLIAPTPEDYAVSAIATIGRTSNTTGYWAHGIMYLVASALPKWLIMRLQTLHIKNIAR